MISRRLLTGLLAVLLVLQPSQAWARDSFPMPQSRALEIVQKLNFQALPKALQNLKAPQAKVNEALTRLAKSRPAEMSAHFGQTLLFLLTVTGVEIVMEELRRRGEGKPSDVTLTEMAQIAATHILDSGGTYLAILGAGLADLGFKYPAQAIGVWLADPKTRPILHQSLAHSIRATGGLLGWEFGATLWSEATLMLETPAEFERSKSLFGMIGGSVRSLFSAEPRDAFDAQLLKTMAWNLLRVALLEQELRSQWIDITFRTRIMNGETAILTAALTAAGVATIWLPGGGTVAGFIIGAAAVVIALNIPEEIKDGITSGMQLFRMGFERGRIRTVEMELREPVGRASRLHAGSRHEQVRELLQRRSSLRSSYLTISLERARLVFKGLFTKRGSATPWPVAQTQLRGIFTDMQDFLNEQSEVTERLIKRSASNPNREVTPLLEREQARILNLSSFFLAIAVELDELGADAQGKNEFQTASSAAQQYIKFIETSYARGFNEKSLFKD